MNLNITIDLESAVAKALSPEKLAPILDKHVTEAIADAVRDVTGYRSEFREAVKKQLAELMPHGLDLSDVAKFQQVLNDSLRTAVQCANQDAVSTALERAVKDVMPDVPPVLKLSELMDAARHGLGRDDHEAFYAFLDISEYGTGHLFLDGDENPGSRSHGTRESKKYSARYQLAFTKEGEAYALHLDGRAVTPKSRPDVISAFDSMLMALYVGRSRLDVDMDEDDVESAAQEKYE